MGVVITGCIYALVPVDKSRGNITGMILRTNGDEVEVEIDRIGCYEELVVTVVENGATNLLSLPRRMQLRQNFTFDCPLAGMQQLLSDNALPANVCVLNIISSFIGNRFYYFTKLNYQGIINTCSQKNPNNFIHS